MNKAKTPHPILASRSDHPLPTGEGGARDSGRVRARGNESAKHQNRVKEFRGFEDLGLPEPTRFGDWEVKGRCSDF